jgi:hypothetical protein
MTTMPAEDAKRKAQAQVHMVGHRVDFHQLDPSLTTHLAQDRANLPPQSSAQDFQAVPRYDHHMVLALSLHMVPMDSSWS